MSEQTQTDEFKPYTDADRPTMLRISEKLRGFVDQFGKWASWLIVPLATTLRPDCLSTQPWSSTVFSNGVG